MTDGLLKYSPEAQKWGRRHGTSSSGSQGDLPVGSLWGGEGQRLPPERQLGPGQPPVFYPRLQVTASSLPMESLSVKPKMPFTWLKVTCF